MRKYLSLLLLTGCMSSYQPHLASPPANQIKYESDRKSCVAEAIARGQKAREDNSTNNLAIGSFGLLAVPAAIAEGTSDYNKSGYEMTDECMAKKGYKIL